jgi:hypothetical protein
VRTPPLVIKPSPHAPVVTSSPTAVTQAKAAVSYQVTALNGATSYEVLDAPEWPSLGASMGLLTGTPPLSGTVTVQLGGHQRRRQLHGARAPAYNRARREHARGHERTSGRRSDRRRVQLPNRSVERSGELRRGGPAKGLALDSTSGLISGTPKA